MGLTLDGAVFILGSYIGCFLLHLLIPARIVNGYCCDNTGKPLPYRLNGFLVLLITVIIFVYLPEPCQIILYKKYWEAFITVNIFGISVSLAYFCRGGKEKFARCVTVDQSKNLNTLQLAGPYPGDLAAFYLGHEWNPRLFGDYCDVKMLLYIIGAIGLLLNILSCIAFEIQRDSKISIGMTAYSVCFLWFIGEYMLGEEVHLYTYDLFAEKIGFKLLWCVYNDYLKLFIDLFLTLISFCYRGCIVFYPFFYGIGLLIINTVTFSYVTNSRCCACTVICVGAFSIVSSSKDISSLQAVGVVVLFFSGWIMTRGANMQKFYFRINPESKTFLFGLVRQKTIPGTRILCSGWWGLARHLNYFGEIVQGIALALPGFLMGSSLYYQVIPWLYPLYYIALFIPRQIDDDAVCKAKYGAKWDEYCMSVPYRIVPGVW